MRYSTSIAAESEAHLGSTILPAEETNITRIATQGEHRVSFIGKGSSFSASEMMTETGSSVAQS